jgi:hypothetical protein
LTQKTKPKQRFKLKQNESLKLTQNIKIFTKKGIKHLNREGHEEHSSRTQQTQILIQTSFHTIKGRVVFEIMQGSIM